MTARDRPLCDCPEPCGCYAEGYAAGIGDVTRLREGRTNTARGTAHFLSETVSRVRYAGARGQLTVRAGLGRSGKAGYCRYPNGRLPLKDCCLIPLISATGRTRPGTLRHLGVAVPSAPPHDRQIRSAGAGHPPGQTHPVEVAGNSPVYSHGCKSPLPVAEWVAGKPSCKAFGRKPYFRYSSQG